MHEPYHNFKCNVTDYTLLHIINVCLTTYLPAGRYKSLTVEGFSHKSSQMNPWWNYCNSIFMTRCHFTVTGCGSSLLGASICCFKCKEHSTSVLLVEEDRRSPFGHFCTWTSSWIELLMFCKPAGQLLHIWNNRPYEGSNPNQWGQVTWSRQL